MSCHQHSSAPPKSDTGHRCCGNDHSTTHVHQHQHGDEHHAAADCCSTSAPSCNGAKEGADDDDPEPGRGCQRLTWQVVGMDCPSCAQKVETAVNRLTQVTSARVVFATERLLVDINSSNPTEVKQSIEAAVQQAGFSFTSSTKSPSEQDERSTSLFAVFQTHWHAAILVTSILLAAIFSFSAPNASTALFTFATIWGVIPLLHRSAKLIRSGSPFAIETLMSVATIGALILGETAESAMVLVLFMIGEKLESFAAGRARKGVQSLMSLVPEEVTKIVDGKRVNVAAEALLPGDVIEIRPGERLAADARLLEGQISFDESALTGESVPVEHPAGDTILAGSLAVDRVARLTVVSEPGNNAIDRILHMIEEAEEHKAPIERFLDRFSRWYTPAMMLLALAVVLLPPLLVDADWSESVYKGLTLLLIACPCALVISTPAAVTSALAAASQRGVLVKGGAALEQLGHICQIAFDKTGTLTQGSPKLTQLIAFGRPEEEVLQLAASLEQHSSHPLAKAIVKAAQEQALPLSAVTDDRTLNGMGMQGRIGHDQIQLLAPRHLAERLVSQPEIQEQINTLELAANTVVVVCSNDQIIGLIGLADSLREDAKQALTELHSQGVSGVMLTGDNQRTAAVIAASLGIDYRAELLPEDKLAILAELSAGEHCAMVGDGINDAPAMKRASLGIAMGGGTDVALEAADIALIHNRLTELPQLILLGRATLANIKQNISLAVGLKMLFLVTTLLGMTGLWVAILADSGATALVTANALRLLKYNGSRRNG